MIRERRSKEKLEQYYRKFVDEGILDPNIHPWVSESWVRSKAGNVSADFMAPKAKMNADELTVLRSRNQYAIDFLGGLYHEIGDLLNIYKLSLLLLDKDCYVLENYALPFFQQTPEQLVGARLGEQDIGTSSISVALQHEVPFLMFGPEMWAMEGHPGDACTAPVKVDGQLEYLITLVSVEPVDLPYNAIVAVLFSMKYSLEHYLDSVYRLEAKQAILDASPFAVYQIRPGGEVAYANTLGKARLGKSGQPDAPVNLNDVVLNFRHSPLYKGFHGIPTHNREMTWITKNKTFEDMVTVLPIWHGDTVSGVASLSMPIEDLRTLAARAAGYTARYTLDSMVGETGVFVAMKEKARRAAQSSHNVLLQGEAGTGKQRLAHGIHQASVRRAGPLITVRCGGIPPAWLAQELFGSDGNEDGNAGKIALADGGTLFLDEVEKLPPDIAARLAERLSVLQKRRGGAGGTLDIRVIAACDSDLKRLTEKEMFDPALYKLIAQTVIRIPPLRNRREDIPVLVDHIIAELAQQHRLPDKNLTADAYRLLEAYEWPGNTKQLQTAVEQAFFHTQHAVISSGDIALPAAAEHPTAWKEDREVFLAAWKSAGGNVSRLAGRLGISRVTLYRYLKKFGLGK